MMKKLAKVMGKVKLSQPPSSEEGKLENERTNGQLFAGKKLRCLNQLFLSKGGCGSVYRGFWKENEKELREVAIRRVEIKDCHENWENLVSLNHDNVLKIIGYEEVQDHQYRYFALERYGGTLEQFCNGDYTGPMPSDAQVLYHIANGINYLHTVELAHGHLNPRTILIAQSQPVRMKVSADSSLKKFIDQTDFQNENPTLSQHTPISTASSYFPEHWMLIGSWKMSQDVYAGKKLIFPTATVHGDVFSAGCLFFYFLKRGLHPFGDAGAILANIRKKKPVNLNKLDNSHFAYESIKKLIGKSPKSGEQLLHGAAKRFADILPLQVDETKKLGSGAFGIVYAGTYEGNQVAVKKIPVDKINNEINLQRKRAMELHKQLDHGNVLKLLHVDEEMHPNFMCIVLELCEGTLTQYCDKETCKIQGKRYLGPDLLPPDVLVLFQIALGLDYIHSRNLVHHDVKPDNILVSRTNPVQMKISDLDFCKEVNAQGSFSQSKLKGTLIWMAPEMLEILNADPENIPKVLPRETTIGSDTFSVGCVFFYFLTRGSHPFGMPTFVPANICHDNPVSFDSHTKNLKEEDYLGQSLYDLIGKMIIKKKDERISLTEVIRQLTSFLPANYEFKASLTQISGQGERGLHQTDPTLACGSNSPSLTIMKASSHRGIWKENGMEKEVVIRRVRIKDCHENWEKIQSLNHDNVHKVVGYEEDVPNQYRYFALDQYGGSLEQFCNGHYKGPMPSDAQVLYQIANGINYLHTVELAHGHLNPKTIVIAHSQPVRVKVSEFGLSKFIDLTEFQNGNLTKSQQTRINKASSYLPQHWMLTGSWKTKNQDGNKVVIPTATVHGDVFAAGCLFFYFLKRGLHPFGDPESILANIQRKNPYFLYELDNSHFAYEPIKKLIGESPKNGEQWLHGATKKFADILSLKIDENKEIGRGGFGIVYAGIYEGNQVAVKKIPVDKVDEDIILQREVELHKQLDHENVLKLLHIDEDKDPNFMCIALELCEGTLTQFCDEKTCELEGKRYLGPDLLPPDVLVLYQIAVGLDYIHSRNLVHRDVKPDNILVSLTNPVHVKLADFGLCKQVSPRGTFSQSKLRGTLHWMAPEILEILGDRDNIPEVLPRGTIKSDTFAAGCVFFYFLTRGSHPFGSPTFVPANICNGNPVALHSNAKKLEMGDKRRLYDLIGEMIKKKEERVALTEVIQQLTALIPAENRQFKKIAMSLPQISGYYCWSRFHPTEPVLASGSDSSSVILLKGANGSIPFSNWRIKQEFQRQTQSGITALEWNVNGTQLAAGLRDGTVIVWSYPSGDVLCEEKKHSDDVRLIAWNPFRQDVLATRDALEEEKLLFWNSRGENEDAEKANHFLTLKGKVSIWSVAWISANQIAIGLKYGEIEICEIDEDEGSSRVVKRFIHGEQEITDLQWNERTKYLASSWDDESIKMWSMDSDQPVHSLQVHSNCWYSAWRRNVKTDNDEGVDDARKQKENFLFACGLEDGSVVVWNPLEENETNRKRILPQKHPNQVWSLSFSPDGRFLASTDNGRLVIWSTETWLPVFTCQNDGHELSWMSTDSSSVPANKLAVTNKNKVCVIEQSFTD